MLRDDPGRNADRCCLCRDVLQDNSVRADGCSVANHNSAEDLGAGSDVDVLPYARGIIRSIQVTVSKCDALANDGVVADGAIAVEDDVALVLDDDPSTQPHGVGQLDPVDVASPLEEPLVEEAEWGANQPQLDLHAPYTESMNGHGPKAWLGPVAVVGVPVFLDVTPERQF